MRFGEGRDLAGAGEAARLADIGSDVLRASGGEQVAELPDRAESLAVGQGCREPPGKLSLERDGVDLDGVLEEERPELGERLRDDDAVSRGQLAMQLEDQVHVEPDGLATGGRHVAHALDDASQRVVL